MGKLGPLERGRQAFSRHEWVTAFSSLSEADRASELGPEDLERLGNAAYLTGKDDHAIASWSRAHTAFADRGDCLRAARLGFWVSLSLLVGGKGAQSTGWLARTRRTIGDRVDECAEHGFVLIMDGLFAMFQGECDEAYAAFERATRLAERFGDADLLAISLLGQGQALVQSERTRQGAPLLDEAMVAVTAGEVSPIMAGLVYCAVILTCERVFDVQRAHEWTVALDEWCASQPELGAFRGQCLVHRSELRQLEGDWPLAVEEAERAYELLSARSNRLAGRALYQQAELHRLRGELDLAEQAYRDAGESGFEPQPGLSLLRLARGDLKAATASIRRVGGEAGSQQGPGAGTQRAGVLGPMVEILLAAGDLDAAEAAANELVDIAAALGAPFVAATAAQSRGEILLARGEAANALAALREAWTTWQKLEAPYQSARVRVSIARACELLGDPDGAATHLQAAATVFERLGAAPDLERLRRPAQSATGAAASLSKREREVLALVAGGKTNRQIAAELGISEHTVARHLSNIFNKIDVSSRTAASAFAFENDLV